MNPAKELRKIAGKIKGPGKPDRTGPYGGTEECQLSEEEEKKKKKKSMIARELKKIADELDKSAEKDQRPSVRALVDLFGKEYTYKDKKKGGVRGGPKKEVFTWKLDSGIVDELGGSDAFEQLVKEKAESFDDVENVVIRNIERWVLPGGKYVSLWMKPKEE